MSLVEDVNRAAADVDKWRATHLRQAADRLDRHIEKLRTEAEQYRELARQLDASHG